VRNVLLASMGGMIAQNWQPSIQRWCTAIFASTAGFRQGRWASQQQFCRAVLRR
jgi:hypothetical protein